MFISVGACYMLYLIVISSESISSRPRECSMHCSTLVAFKRIRPSVSPVPPTCFISDEVSRFTVGSTPDHFWASISSQWELISFWPIFSLFRELSPLPEHNRFTICLWLFLSKSELLCQQFLSFASYQAKLFITLLLTHRSPCEWWVGACYMLHLAPGC